jgi:DNA-binding NtrC family response regulator
VGHSQPAVLLVEDEMLIRMVVADYLRDEDFRVVEASDADEAIEILERRRDILAVVTDIRMPGTLNGIALALQVESRWPHIRVILTSGYPATEDNRLPESIPFLRKPYDPADIASLLRGLA